MFALVFLGFVGKYSAITSESWIFLILGWDCQTGNWCLLSLDSFSLSPRFRSVSKSLSITWQRNI